MHMHMLLFFVLNFANVTYCANVNRWVVGHAGKSVKKFAKT